MSTKQSIVCDACGKEEGLQTFRGRWYHVTTLISNEQELSRMVQAAGGPDIASKDTLGDFGDFCSLRCLANWAGGRDALRSLDADG